MTEKERNWRDAKLPAWIKASIAEDMENMALKAALSWPTEAKPTPLPFQWGDYDRLIGEPTPGCYWAIGVGNHVMRFDLAFSRDLPDSETENFSRWKHWAFKSAENGKWSSSVIRGPLFASERDARLYKLWLLCEQAAKTLKSAREKLE